jgi:S-adenosylmethionine:tRNA ribosyltransferase-isomerase
MLTSVFIDEYDYTLPAEQIATAPLTRRDASKLLVYQNGTLKDDTFYHLNHNLPPESLLVLNNTRVLEARIHFEKPTGSLIEVFCLEPFQPAAVEDALQQTQTVQWRCFIGGASKWGHGQVLQKQLTINGTDATLEAIYIKKEADSFVIQFRWSGGAPFADVLQTAGAVPLPPYIKRKAVAEDADRYQTVFAQQKGSVAAPTAALHFTHDVFKKLEAAAIRTAHLTLHVGAGTFKPVKTETIADHHMHAETFTVSMPFLQRLLEAETIIAAGTTLSWASGKPMNWPCMN